MIVLIETNETAVHELVVTTASVWPTRQHSSAEQCNLTQTHRHTSQTHVTDRFNSSVHSQPSLWCWQSSRSNSM